MRFFGQNWTKNQVVNGPMDIDQILPICIVVIKHMFIAEQTPPNNSLSFVTQNKMARSYGRIPQSFHINVFWCGSLHKISLKMI